MYSGCEAARGGAPGGTAPRGDGAGGAPYAPRGDREAVTRMRHCGRGQDAGVEVMGQGHQMRQLRRRTVTKRARERAREGERDKAASGILPCPLYCQQEWAAMGAVDGVSAWVCARVRVRVCVCVCVWKKFP